jgi:hypothetical protein
MYRRLQSSVSSSTHTYIHINIHTYINTYSAEDEVASTAAHTISESTEKDFCNLCLNVVTAFGVGGCRAEYYTNENLAKCGIVVGEKKK